MKAFIYPSKDGWRWHIIRRNGRLSAESGEAYTRSYDAKKALNDLLIDLKLEGLEIVVKRERKPAIKKAKAKR